MSAAQEILTYAKQHHIHLEGNGENLAIEAPRNLLTEQFLSEVKEHKTELIRVLTTSEPEINIGLSIEDEIKIRKLFAALKETDSDLIAALLEDCRTIPGRREYFLEWADHPVPIFIPTGDESWAQ